MLKDHGVHRTGKEGCENTALVKGAELCGPDQHSMKARFRLHELDKACDNNGPMCSMVEGNWEERRMLFRHMNRLEKRKNRGGANFSPEDAC